MASAALMKLLKAAKNKNLTAAQAKKLNQRIKAQKAADAKAGTVAKPKSKYDPQKSVKARAARRAAQRTRAKKQAQAKKHPIATKAGRAVGKAGAKTKQAARSAKSKIARNKGKIAGGAAIAAGTGGVIYENTRRGRKPTNGKATETAPKTSKTTTAKPKATTTAKPKKPSSAAYKGKFGDAMRMGPDGGPSAAFKSAAKRAQARRAKGRKTAEQKKTQSMGGRLARASAEGKTSTKRMFTGPAAKPNKPLKSKSPADKRKAKRNTRKPR